MTSRVFGLRAANCPACNNWPQHSRFTAIECFAAASTALTPGSAGSAETLSHEDPDARRPRFAFHDLGALCRGCVPAPRGMRSFVAVQGECRYGPNRRERAGGNGGGPQRSADHRDRAWIGVRTAAILAAGVAGCQFPSVFDAVECGVAV